MRIQNRKIISTVILCLLLLNFQVNAAFARQDPKEIFDRGVSYLKSDNLSKAKKDFKKVTSMSFGHYPSYFNLSRLSLLQEDYKNGLKHLEKAKEFNPFDIRTNKMYSSAHMLLKNYTDAKQIISEITSKNPADIETHKKLGIIYLKENISQGAIEEFTLIKNLSPNDLNGNLLLGMSFAKKNDFKTALDKVKPFVDELVRDDQLAFYAFILENNSFDEAASSIYTKIEAPNKEKIIDSLLSNIEKEIILDELSTISAITDFQNPEVSKRIALKVKHEKELAAIGTQPKETKPRPLNLKGTVTETFELYDRTPKTSSPINALSVTSNIKLEGKTSGGIDVTAEVESFYNRWDNQKLDYFKINATKKDDFEIDLGKFSSKHFGTLVSYPTVLEGTRVWKKLTLPEFKPTEAPFVQGNPDNPINLGEIYRENYVDNRMFENIEVTMVIGKTKKRKNVDDRKEKNERSYETSGQHEQWTHAYRVHSKINSVLELGSSLAMTQDRSDDRASVTDTTNPLASTAFGIDGGLDLLDNDLNLDAEFAWGNYNEDTTTIGNRHLKDTAWLIKSKYKFFDTVTLSYEQKRIGRNFKVEGASQTQNKMTHALDVVYKPQKPRTWFISSQTFKFKPERTNLDGLANDKKSYMTYQSVTDFKLPQDAKYTLDCKYYREKDKCFCADYKTITVKNSLDWTIKGTKTKIKPSYTFERKDDLLASGQATDEKKKEYIITIENKSIKNLELDYSWEREIKDFSGATTKQYSQYINTFEAKYTLIPSRLDTSIKASQDFKNPSDTNKTDITTLTYELNYTSKSGDDKLQFKYERKNNIYLPWSDSSAYRQNYWKLKYTKKF